MACKALRRMSRYRCGREARGETHDRQRTALSAIRRFLVGAARHIASHRHGSRIDSHGPRRRGGWHGTGVRRHRRAVLDRRRLPGPCESRRCQPRGRHRLSPASNEKRKAGQKNEEFSKGHSPHADNIRGTPSPFKITHRAWHRTRRIAKVQFNPFGGGSRPHMIYARPLQRACRESDMPGSVPPYSGRLSVKGFSQGASGRRA